MVMVGLLLALAARYGFHRDELYFIESAKHLAWGYVDNPPLTPLLGRLSRAIFGDSVFGLRVVPAVEAGLVVVAVAALTREFGARAAAQVLAAILTATASFVLAIGHLLTTPTLDVLVTVLVVWCLVRMVRTGDQRWWLLVGIGVGIGLENKFTIVVVVVSLAAGAVVTRSWRPLVSVWTLAGAAVAVALWAPNLWWQAHHGWTLLSFSRVIARDQGADNRAQLVPSNCSCSVHPSRPSSWRASGASGGDPPGDDGTDRGVDDDRRGDELARSPATSRRRRYRRCQPRRGGDDRLRQPCPRCCPR